MVQFKKGHNGEKHLEKLHDQIFIPTVTCCLWRNG